MFVGLTGGLYLFSPFFFFQAEDGIRDYKVTGVQTCALPICDRLFSFRLHDDRVRPDDHADRGLVGLVQQLEGAFEDGLPCSFSSIFALPSRDDGHRLDAASGGQVLDVGSKTHFAYLSGTALAAVPTLSV